MLKLFRSRRGQSSVSEYVLLLGVAGVVITGMTVYIQRLMQARFRDIGIVAVQRASAAAPTVESACTGEYLDETKVSPQYMCEHCLGQTWAYDGLIDVWYCDEQVSGGSWVDCRTNCDPTCCVIVARNGLLIEYEPYYDRTSTDAMSRGLDRQSATGAGWQERFSNTERVTEQHSVQIPF
jgi:hypothetical protein